MRSLHRRVLVLILLAVNSAWASERPASVEQPAVQSEPDVGRFHLQLDQQVQSARNLLFLDGQGPIPSARAAIGLGWRGEVMDDVYFRLATTARFTRGLGRTAVSQALWLNNLAYGGLAAVEANQTALWSGAPDWVKELRLAFVVRREALRFFTSENVKQERTGNSLQAMLETTGRAGLALDTDLELKLFANAYAAGGFSTVSVFQASQPGPRGAGSVEAGVGMGPVDVFGGAAVDANFWYNTDWDNRAQAHYGVRAYAWRRFWEEQSQLKQLLLFLHAQHVYVIGYWPYVEYVPSFRPMEDVRLTLRMTLIVEEL